MSNDTTGPNLSKSVQMVHPDEATRPILPGGWRSGRSISLTGPQEYAGTDSGTGGGAGIGGGKKKLAKTSHMHEFKGRSRRGTVNELDASLALLSPMAENPSSPYTASEWHQGNPGSQTPFIIDPAHEAPKSTSNQMSNATLSEKAGLGPQAKHTTVQPIGVPFPSPGMDTDIMVYGRDGDEDLWVDESGSEKAHHQQEASRRSPKGTQRFMNSHRVFAFSSSPPGGKGRFRFRRGDVDHKPSASTGSTGQE